MLLTLLIVIRSAPGGAGSRRPPTAPSSSSCDRGLQREPGMAVRVAGSGPAASVPPSPSYSNRRVRNTATALKTAILDEIVGEAVAEEGC